MLTVEKDCVESGEGVVGFGEGVEVHVVAAGFVAPPEGMNLGQFVRAVDRSLVDPFGDSVLRGSPDPAIWSTEGLRSVRGSDGDLRSQEVRGQETRAQLARIVMLGWSVARPSLRKSGRR